MSLSVTSVPIFVKFYLSTTKSIQTILLLVGYRGFESHPFRRACKGPGNVVSIWGSKHEVEAMSHKTDTQFRQNPMPRHSGLLCRQGRYYLNVRVPTDLRPLYGKQDIIRRSLKTSEYREAISRVRFESFRLESEFASKRRTLIAAKDASSAVVREISDQEAHEIVYRFFIALEKSATGWWNAEGYRMGPGEVEGVLDNLRIDETAYNGGGQAQLPADISPELDRFLDEQEINIERNSPAYRKLTTLFRLARLENVRRSQDRVAQNPIASREPVFREVYAHTPPPAARLSVTLGDMLNRFSKALVDAKRTQGTQRTYQIPARILREVIGENRSLDAITREDIERLFELLRRAPANAVQKYPSLTVCREWRRSHQREASSTDRLCTGSCTLLRNHRIRATPVY